MLTVVGQMRRLAASHMRCDVHLPHSVKSHWYLVLSAPTVSWDPGTCQHIEGVSVRQYRRCVTVTFTQAVVLHEKVTGKTQLFLTTLFSPALPPGPF